MRLVRALVVEIHETWLEATRYLNMEHLSRAQEGEPEGIGRLSAARCARRSTTWGLLGGRITSPPAILQNLTHKSIATRRPGTIPLDPLI
ncbi:hypothetical protein A9K66_00385 [Mesorhizobium sp. AA23]|nr:hypothetical protein A9K66_00385 [Mesorhizobium sp. AA23]